MLFLRPLKMAPERSHRITSFTPDLMSSLVTAIPAAPAPFTTMRRSDISRRTNFTAFNMAASTTIAVPCWSSWNTGISSAALSFSSISKQRGAAISSRLIPPSDGEIATARATISSGSRSATQIGNASTPASERKRAALPSITGIAACGPISPNPSTAEPSVTTPTRLPLPVNSYTCLGSSRMM